MSPEEIAEASPTNRMASWPYTKAMSANNTVDRATVNTVTSTETVGTPANVQGGRLLLNGEPSPDWAWPTPVE